jgi:hypothetical protein
MKSMGEVARGAGVHVSDVSAVALAIGLKPLAAGGALLLDATQLDELEPYLARLKEARAERDRRAS